VFQQCLEPVEIAHEIGVFPHDTQPAFYKGDKAQRQASAAIRYRVSQGTTRIRGTVGVLADCGTSLPPQDKATADRGNPRRFHRSATWEKSMDDFLHESKACCPVFRNMHPCPGSAAAGYRMWANQRREWIFPSLPGRAEPPTGVATRLKNP
jgi:hypothetical protein